MERARKRVKLEEGEVLSSDDDCIIVDAPVKKAPESPKLAQGHSHHLSSLKTNTAPDPFCSECCRYFPSDAEKEKHNSKWHYRNLCHECDEGFPTQAELKQTHFASPAKKQKHVMSGLPVKPGTFLCDHCDPKVLFESEKELCTHLWLDHMACGPCGQVFETAVLKKKHDAEAHNRCAVCYRFFKSSAELKQHRGAHQVEPSVIEPPVVEPPVVEPSIVEPLVVHPLPAKPEPTPNLQRASKQLYR
ncbi:zinc finger BTB domain-containing protein [Fusarium bulbicola]|nr:zinc finger BTB domain-containing protein [Fusarium bulbicola]